MTAAALYAALDARVSALERDVQRLREWRHNLPSELILPIQKELHSMRVLLEQQRPAGDTLGTGENRKITMRDFYICVGTLAVGWTLLKAFGVIP